MRCICARRSHLRRTPSLPRVPLSHSGSLTRHPRSFCRHFAGEASFPSANRSPSGNAASLLFASPPVEPANPRGVRLRGGPALTGSPPTSPPPRTPRRCRGECPRGIRVRPHIGGPRCGRGGPLPGAPQVPLGAPAHRLLAIDTADDVAADTTHNARLRGQVRNLDRALSAGPSGRVGVPKGR